MVNISLNTSMRSNLLSLQQIAELQAVAQNRLASGMKVNSAIDTPSSFYSAQSLNNRAKDLSLLLDSMSNGIQTIKMASQTLSKGGQYLEQAKAIAHSAIDNLKKSEDTDYSDYTHVSSKSELISALNDSSITNILLTQSVSFDDNEKITLGNGKTLAGLDQTISLNFKNTKDKNNIYMLTMEDNSRLSSLSINFEHTQRYGTSYAVSVEQATAVLDNVNIITKGYYASGLNLDESHVSGTINIFSNDEDSSGILSNDSMIDANISIITNGDDATGLEAYDSTIKGLLNIETKGINSYGLSLDNVIFSATANIITRNDDSWALTSYDGTIISGEINAATYGQDAEGFSIVDSTISKNAVIKIYSEKINTISFYDSAIETGAEFYLANNGAAILTSYKAGNDWTGATQDGNYSFLTTTGNNKNSSDFKSHLEKILTASPTLQSSAVSLMTIDNNNQIDTTPQKKSALSTYNTQYNSLLSQFDLLINDGSYKGINLLNNQWLTINFNEDFSSKIDIAGIDISAESLELKQADWQDEKDIDVTLKKLENAINKLRTYENRYGNYYSIVTEREDFTNRLINVLTEGADKLTLADMNEESANMLALETRQLLAVNSLSLASQTSRSILKLF